MDRITDSPVKRLWQRAALVAVVLVAAGCASVGASKRTDAPTAYAHTEPRLDGVRSWRSVDATHDEQGCVRANEIDFHAAASLDPGERLLLRRELGDALRLRFAESGLRACTLASDRASLTVRATVMAVERTRPALNAVTAYLRLAPPSRGGMAVEFEAIDSRSARRVAAMVFEGRSGGADIGSASSGLGQARKQAGLAAARFAAVVTASRAMTLEPAGAQAPLAKAASIITCVPRENSSGHAYAPRSLTARLNVVTCSS